MQSAVIGRNASFPLVGPANVVDAIRFHSAHASRRKAITFLTDGEGKKHEVDFSQIDRMSQSVAAYLMGRCGMGDRVLLLYPPGIDYVAAFLGCLYAARIPVPVYPPRRNRSLDRLQAIVQDCRPTIALSTPAIAETSDALVIGSRVLSVEGILASEESAFSTATFNEFPEIRADRVAFLQYTSGSTSTPKGVMVTHANLTANFRMLEDVFGVTEDSVIVSWLPPYHDMGLIGTVLLPLWSGTHTVLMPPAAFLQRPLRWLRAIEDFRATISGGPDAAYRLCATKNPADAGIKDLSSWRVAFNGSEPVLEQTISRFGRTFAPIGFDSGAFLPCYGLAEATLFASGSRASRAALVVPVSAQGLERGAFQIETGHQKQKRIVSSGAPAPGVRIVTVHPEKCCPTAPGEIGEIWIASPSVATGYFENRELTENVFEAKLTSETEGTFLRTGDLGIVHNGELFVTGRLKELIILNGRNIYPHDVEFTALEAAGKMTGTCAAFAVSSDDGEERLAVLFESGPLGDAAGRELFARIREALVQEYGIPPHYLLAVRTGSLPKTSSGKLRRKECLRQFVSGELVIVYSDAVPENCSEQAGSSPQFDSLTAVLLDLAADVLNRKREEFSIHEPLISLGLDSLRASELSSAIEKHSGIAIPFEMILDGATLKTLVEHVNSALDHPAAGAAAGAVDRASNSPWFPLSDGQRAIWFLDRLAREQGAYHISTAARIFGPLDLHALQSAFTFLIHRHESFRTTMAVREGQPWQRSLESVAVPFQLVEAANDNPDVLHTRMKTEACAPFDLEAGPPFRVVLFRLSDQEYILLVTVHHIVADLHTMCLLFSELDEIYSALRQKEAPGLPAVASSYRDLIERYRRAALADAELERLKAFWLRQLQGDWPLLPLPSDHARPAVQTYSGQRHIFHLGSELSERIEAFAGSEGVTPYTLLLAVFQVLLIRYTGERDIRVGSPVSLRGNDEADVAGYHINQIVLRTRADDLISFREFLQQTRSTVLEALSHRHYPLSHLADLLKPERDASHTPLFQVMFSYQQAPFPGAGQMMPFALGQPGGRIECDSIVLESIDFDQGTAQLDLTLLITKGVGGMSGAFQYNTSLFEPASIARMEAHFRTLLEGALEDPRRPIGLLPLMPAAERLQILRGWNDTAMPGSTASFVHELFEAQANQHPADPAVIYRDEQVTYGDLQEQSDRIAAFLSNRQIQFEYVVGICLDRTPDMLAAVLGVLKAGAAYLPLDPDYPPERLKFMLRDSGAALVLAERRLCNAFAPHHQAFSVPDAVVQGAHAVAGRRQPLYPDALAYLIYTSGSTGTPKGVMVSHSNVLNFLAAMDNRIGFAREDTMLAPTSLSFDISVLEILWPLTNGGKVVILENDFSKQQKSIPRSRQTDFSVFYFASASRDSSTGKYQLLIEGAKIADRNGFEAVWTPERHFHEFGGLYPNPSVTAAALSMATQRLAIRGGSVVLPLHHPIRVAEEWSVVDNLSGGRTGIAFASGWHANDFVFQPENYADRKEILFGGIERVRRFWRGEEEVVRNGVGEEIRVKLFPAPVQTELPVWVTAAGSIDTFRKAGEIGANVLTHLLGQTVEDLAGRIRQYREARSSAGYDPEGGRVTLMVHAFLARDRNVVRDIVRQPFTEYLRSSVGLIGNLVQSLKLPLDLHACKPEDMRALLDYAFERYFDSNALFGTVETCLDLVAQLRSIGVDEIACLIDFGVETNQALASLEEIVALRHRTNASKDRSLERASWRGVSNLRPSMLQCTPGLLSMLLAHGPARDALGQLRTVLVGGDSLPASLARQVTDALGSKLVNMYGPTETTIWSSTKEIEGADKAITVGRPIANTEMYILSESLELVPVGVIGDLYIGGLGVARGYAGQPALTAERFIPHPFGVRTGGRLYKTGDRARFRPGGEIELLGRSDFQIKVRGFRVEPAEIEAALNDHPLVNRAVVMAHDDGPAMKRLVAYIKPSTDGAPAQSDLRTLLSGRLPEHMIPSVFIFLDELPLNSNGKVDRRALEASYSAPANAESYVAPANNLERSIAEVWRRVLKVERVGIDDNFFDAGGHSLLLVQAHAQLTQLVGCEVPLVRLLQHPTIRSLAAYLAPMRDETVTETSAAASVDRGAKRRDAILHRAAAIGQLRGEG